MSADLQQALIGELRQLLGPVIDAATPEGRRRLIAAVGWNLDAITGIPVAQVDAGLEAFGTAYGELEALAADPPESLDEMGRALRAADAIASGLAAVGEIAASNGVGRPPEFERMGVELIDLLATLHLATHRPVLFQLLGLLALVDAEPPAVAPQLDPGSGELARFPASRVRLRLDLLPALLRDPVAHLRAAYLGPAGLATEADAQRVSDNLFPRIAALAAALGIQAAYGRRPGGELDLGEEGNRLAARMLSVEWAPATNGSVAAALGVSLGLTSAEREGAGLVAVPTASLTFEQALRAWNLQLGVSAAIAAVALRAGGVTIAGPAEAGSVEAKLTATKLQQDGVALRIGAPRGTRLELGGLVLDIVAGLAPETFDLELAADAAAGAFVLAASDGDGFLARVLPREGVRLEFDAGLHWSRSKGLHLRGGAGLDATLPVRSQLGPVRVDAVHLALTAGETAVEASAAITAAISLGPVTATVERVGMQARLRPDAPGNLGPATLAAAFKPPAGAALKIDAGVVQGGGYLFFDAAREQYAGVVRLEVDSRIALTAVGLLTTRMPDGRPGFSLLVIITAEGFSPIPLGMGFTLTGVGGLVGVNRTANAAALRAGVKTGALDSVLFPADPIRDAPAIVSTLNAAMPPADGRFLIGPMALIAWGTPTILTIKLALLLELPQPVRLMLLGRLSALLPSKDKPLVRLQMEAFGLLDFDRGELSLDATLFDSRLLQFVMTGDMALRIAWGAAPTFVLSVGGFNPRFPVPAGFPALERVAVSLAQRPEFSLRLAAYLAVTSNSVQLGARMDLSAAAGGFTLTGLLGFDTLVQLSPFGFVADVAANLALRHGGTLLFSVHLEMTLSGPAPWHARGRAGFSIGPVACEVAFDHRFGAPEPLPEPEPVDVGSLLRAELADARNWSGELPDGERPLVTLREAATRGPVVHPLATFTVRQRRVPLNRTITRFGTSRPAGGAASYSLEVTGANGTQQILTDLFARGDFEALSDDERLTAPAFAPMNSGFRVQPPAPVPAAGLTTDAAYETVILGAA